MKFYIQPYSIDNKKYFPLNKVTKNWKLRFELLNVNFELQTIVNSENNGQTSLTKNVHYDSLGFYLTETNVVLVKVNRDYFRPPFFEEMEYYEQISKDQLKELISN